MTKKTGPQINGWNTRHTDHIFLFFFILWNSSLLVVCLFWAGGWSFPCCCLMSIQNLPPLVPVNKVNWQWRRENWNIVSQPSLWRKKSGRASRGVHKFLEKKISFLKKKIASSSPGVTSEAAAMSADANRETERERERNADQVWRFGGSSNCGIHGWVGQTIGFFFVCLNWNVSDKERAEGGGKGRPILCVFLFCFCFCSRQRHRPT